MYRTVTTSRIVGLAVTTAMAGAMLSACSTVAAPGAVASAGRTSSRVETQQLRAVNQAEAAVLASPRDAGARAALGTAYLDLGRFTSAQTSFNDALTLGDTSPRTALSLAVAMIGQGQLGQASVLLNTWSDRIPAADSGLAMALAGQPERGIQLMSTAIRAGQNDAKIRQNLAYAYALAGRWREARLMTEQDLHGTDVDNRLEQFATMAQPEAWQMRVASLLGVPAGVTDPGQPVRLALVDVPATVSAPATALAIATPTPTGELPALADASPVSQPAAVAPVPAPATTLAVSLPAEPVRSAPRPEAAVAVPAPALPQTFAAAFLAPSAKPSPAIAAMAQDTRKVARALARPAPRDTAVQVGTHLVQLGSFASEASARRAFAVYAAKYPELAGHQMVINQAVVRGKNYWRVAAAGYGKSTSASMCGRVKSAGGACFAYAQDRPLPGAIDTGIRLASR